MTTANNEIPSADTPSVRVLIFLLSLVAGTTDVIGYLGLDGLFTAHITGNLVLVCTHLAAHKPIHLSQVLSIPFFAIVVCGTRILAGRLILKRAGTLGLLLLLQLLCIAGFHILCLMSGENPQQGQPVTVLAGMLGVSAMAVQNALAQIAIRNAPSTAIMTTNVTRFAVDVGTLILNANADDVHEARLRAGRTLPVIIGFSTGCFVGAVCEQAFGLRALALPTVLATIVLALGLGIEWELKHDNKQMT